MNDPFDLVLDQQPFLAQAVDGLVVGAVAFGGYHLLVLGVVLLVQFVQVLILLYECLVSDVVVTDEASAIEWSGQAPRLVEGRSDNIKVTRPEDLEWLRQRWAGKR